MTVPEMKIKRKGHIITVRTDQSNTLEENMLDYESLNHTTWDCKYYSMDTKIPEEKIV